MIIFYDSFEAEMLPTTFWVRKNAGVVSNSPPSRGKLQRIGNETYLLIGMIISLL
ncbi:MAG: hypothetical protein OD815_000314 [Candidatus Alkanophagales archaeon MCA70_species_2]|nr:hypothetical protein [Candidatus Alkanophaga liquidiphilum]